MPEPKPLEAAMSAIKLQAIQKEVQNAELWANINYEKMRHERRLLELVLSGLNYSRT